MIIAITRMECSARPFHSMKMTSSTFIVGSSFKDDVSFSRLKEGCEALDDLMKKLTVTESVDSLSCQNTLNDKSDESKNDSNTEDESELIERGPTNNRHRHRSHPYAHSLESPSSCSESSEGSPLNYNGERCSSSGGSFVINVESSSSLENLSQESSTSPEIVHDRHIYIHKNGGNVQVINCSSTLSDRFSHLCSASKTLYDSFESHDLIADSQCCQVEASFVDLSYVKNSYTEDDHKTDSSLKDETSVYDISHTSLSPSSSRSSSNDPSSPRLPVKNKNIIADFENDSLSSIQESSAIPFPYDLFETTEQYSMKSHEDNIENNDMPEELKDFIIEENKLHLEQSSNFHQQYSEKIEDLLKSQVIENSPNGFPDSTHTILESTSIPGTKLNGSFNLSAEGDVKNISTIDSTRPLIQNLYIVDSQPLLLKNSVILVKSPEISPPAKPTQNRFRPLAPKPAPQNESSVMNSNNVSVKKSPCVCDEKVIEELRNCILCQFSEDEKRQQHCKITKCSDKQLMQKDSEGDTMLHVAVLENVMASVYLIERFAKLSSLDILNNAGETALLYAVSSCRVELVKYLLYKGADPNVCVLKNGSTVLHFAAQRGAMFIDVLEVLCKCPKTELNAYNYEGKTPLMSAVESHGKEVKLDDGTGTVVIDSVPAVTCLLRYNASVAYQDRCSGKTVFHYTLEKKDLQLLQCLCVRSEASKDIINMPMFDGNTPLHVVGAMNDCSSDLREKFIHLLVNNGASFRTTNVSNKTPADLVDKNFKEVKKLLTSSRQP